MSVRVNRRHMSPIQFIDSARQIADIIVDRMDAFLKKLGRHYKDCWREAKSTYKYLYESPIKNSIEALKCLKLGNLIFINTAEDFVKRKNYFYQAITHYNLLLTDLSILYHKFYKEQLIKKNSIEYLSKLIDEEINRIRNTVRGIQLPR